MTALRTYLSAQRAFTKADLLKIWKGLFYCFWHSDRPRPQQALAGDLAALLGPMAEHNAPVFYRAFWETLTREWSGIDVLRIDKFLMLVRRFLAAGFRYCRERKWAADMVEALLLAPIEQGPLDPKGNKMPNGIRFQLADIWADELEKLLPEGDDKAAGVPVALLVRPWEGMARDGAQKLWRTKAKEVLLDERLRDWGYKGEFAAKERAEGEDEDEVEEEWAGFE